MCGLGETVQKNERVAAEEGNNYQFLMPLFKTRPSCSRRHEYRLSLKPAALSANCICHLENQTTHTNYCSVSFFYYSHGFTLSTLIWRVRIYLFIFSVPAYCGKYYMFLSPFPAHCKAIKNESQSRIPTYIRGGGGDSERGARLPYVILVICSN